MKGLKGLLIILAAVCGLVAVIFDSGRAAGAGVLFLAVASYLPA